MKIIKTLTLWTNIQNSNIYKFVQVMDCKFASRASDMWGVGAIAFILLSGGVSPFWAGNR